MPEVVPVDAVRSFNIWRINLPVVVLALCVVPAVVGGVSVVAVVAVAAVVAVVPVEALIFQRKNYQLFLSKQLFLSMQ